MEISPRVKKLRDQSLNAVEKISAERALLVTQFYKSDDARELSAPVKRARALEFILKNKKICINDGELIVGERGPAPKETPTYPEISLHSLKDLEILDSREKVFFRVDDEVKKIYEKEIIPFWNGKSNRDRIMSMMTPNGLMLIRQVCLLNSRNNGPLAILCWDTRCSQTGFLACKK